MTDISVVLPIYNEADNVAELVAEIRQAIQPLGRSFEVVCVDDCSTDDSVARIQALAASQPEVRLVRHSCNCGQSAAVITGFHHSRGNIIITMDADRQNDPVDIPRYLEALTDGVDCVCGIRAKRHDASIRRWSSKLANGFRRLIIGDQIQDAGCGFRAIRREVLKEVPAFNGLHRFLPIILQAQGCTIREIPIGHRPRTAGVSKYGVGNRLWRGILDCFAIRWYRRRALRLRRAAD